MDFSNVDNLSPNELNKLKNFYNTANFKPSLVEDKDIKDIKDADEKAVGEERYGRILRQITSPDDFYIWLKYMMYMMYGPLENVQAFIEITPKDLYQKLDVDKTFCHVGNTSNSKKLMMHTNYVMGSRLVVNAAKKKDILGNSKFANLYNQVRTHETSTVDMRSDVSDHHDKSRFSIYGLKDGNYGADG